MPVNNQVPIPTTDPPIGWKAKELVYSKIQYKTPGDKLEFFLSPSSYTIDGDNLFGLITQLLNHDPHLPTGHDKPWGGPGQPKKRTPLDIQVDKYCWVVLELDRKAGWKFPKSGPALTTKEDYGDTNAGLRYVNATGKTSPNPLEDCRIVYFAAVYRDADDVQYFNFNLEMEQVEDGRTVTLEIMIDPDIPNGNGQFQ
jgi:hypothetical protein